MYLIFRMGGKLIYLHWDIFSVKITVCAHANIRFRHEDRLVILPFVNTFSEFRSNRPLYPINDFVFLSFKFISFADASLLRWIVIGFIKNIFGLLGFEVLIVFLLFVVGTNVVVVVVVVDLVVVLAWSNFPIVFVVLFFDARKRKDS